MQNPSQSKPANSKENMEKLNKKIKETWSGLSDSDIKLYEGKRDEFFAKLNEKHQVSKEDAEKKMQQIEKDCGCSGAAKAA
ncbi:MAG: hypothetical protein KJ017_02015 [Alphaproteobacteria bacterium]|nr:hypothetical protein [Alphaproteobacteria bacterium]